MTVIHVLCSKMSYQNFSHTHNHLRCTYRFVINTSLINSTVSTGQLRAIKCLLQ